MRKCQEANIKYIHVVDIDKCQRLTCEVDQTNNYLQIRININIWAQNVTFETDRQLIEIEK